MDEGYAQSKDLMVENFVTAFTLERKVVQSVKHIGTQSDNIDDQKRNIHLMNCISKLQHLLKSMFFDTPLNLRSKNKFAIQDIEELIVSCEIILNTHFKERFV